MGKDRCVQASCPLQAECGSPLSRECPGLLQPAEPRRRGQLSAQCSSDAVLAALELPHEPPPGAAFLESDHVSRCL